WPAALRVSSMRISSDLRGAVVVVDVLGDLVAPRRALVARFRCSITRGLRDDGRCAGGRAADTDCQQEISAGKFGFLLVHGDPPMHGLHTQITAKVHLKFPLYKRDIDAF